MRQLLLDNKQVVSCC